MTDAANARIGYNLPLTGRIAAVPGTAPLASEKGEVKFAFLGMLKWWPRTTFDSDTLLRMQYDVMIGRMHYKITGPPDSPTDDSFVQWGITNPPTVGNVVPQYFYHDALRSRGVPATNVFGTVINAIFPDLTRSSVTKRLAAAPSSAGSDTYSTPTILTPGTVQWSPLTIISEDGTTSTTHTPKLPTYVGTWGNLGIAGQALAGAGANLVLSRAVYITMPHWLTMALTSASRKVDVSDTLGYINVEKSIQVVYNMVHHTGLSNYNDNVCSFVLSTAFADIIQTAMIQVFLKPKSDGWYALVMFSTLRKDQTVGTHGAGGVGGSNPITVSTVTTTVYSESTWTKVLENTTTTITKTLFGGDATLTVTITVTATGQITKCEVKVTPNQTISTSLPGWADKFNSVSI